MNEKKHVLANLLPLDTIRKNSYFFSGCVYFIKSQTFRTYNFNMFFEKTMIKYKNRPCNFLEACF
jgi:hypothetical protein